ncbi:hypothetical protein [Desulfogranum mediterraneum]|uniref:hypothetical protein n=1 Tax=Desulfogranum mediterraneum TaxID=160661 RepID=UPI000427D980|nr:hypothetical protein [Desulfogranum mediterraneum]
MLTSKQQNKAVLVMAACCSILFLLLLNRAISPASGERYAIKARQLQKNRSHSQNRAHLPDLPGTAFKGMEDRETSALAN